MKGKHVAVTDAQLRHVLGIVGDELAVVVQVLGGRLDACLGLDGAPESVDAHIGVHIEREEVALIALDLRIGDTERDLPGTFRVRVKFQADKQAATAGTYIVRCVGCPSVQFFGQRLPSVMTLTMQI